MDSPISSHLLKNQNVFSPSKVIRRANTVQVSEIKKALRTAPNFLDEAKNKNKHTGMDYLDLSSKSSQFDESKVENEPFVSNQEESPQTLLEENQDLLEALSMKIQESDDNTPPKITHSKTTNAYFETTRKNKTSSFFSEQHKSYLDSKQSSDDESIGNVKEQYKKKRLNSPPKSAFALQKLDRDSDQSFVNSETNSPFDKEANRNNIVMHKKSKFFNQNVEKSHVDSQNFLAKRNKNREELEDKKVIKSARPGRKGKMFLTVIPSVSAKDPVSQVDTKQTEAMIKLKREILRKKRLVDLYETIKAKGKTLMNTEPYSRSEFFLLMIIVLL